MELLKNKDFFDVLVVSLGSTVLKISMTLVESGLVARALQESFLLFFMTKLTANKNWMPFGHLIDNKTLASNIDYSNLLVPMPCLSHSMGYYMKVDYQFSNASLLQLLNKLKVWSQVKSELTAEENSPVSVSG